MGELLVASLPQELETRLPLEKSWYGNLGLQDLVADSDTTVRSLSAYNKTQPLSDDLQVVLDSSKQILNGDRTIFVGQGGAWARKLGFASEKFGWGLELIKAGTLNERPDEFEPAMVEWPLEKLGRLNRNSSQLASAAVLCGSNQPMPAGASYHLAMAYEARNYWRSHTGSTDTWEVRRDQTFRRQAISWLGWLSTGTMQFEPVQAEDYPHAYSFGVMSERDALACGWQSLAGHETSRFTSTEETVQQAETGQVVTARDHRLLIMARWRYGREVRLAHPAEISKSWPLSTFNEFTEIAETTYAV